MAIEREREDLLGRDHDELGQVDGIGALAQDHALGAALPAVVHKRHDILKVIGRGIRGQGLRWAQGQPVAAKT